MEVAFNKLSFVDSIVEGERIKRGDVRIRQVVSVLTIKPDGKAMALCMAEGAKVDGKLNISPPQGAIHRHEPVVGAAIRTINVELGVGVSSPPVYLGSARRKLPADHKRAKWFDEYHHHWVAIFADSYDFNPKSSFCKTNWYFLDSLDYLASTSMSKDKAAMFQSALKSLIEISGNRFLVRRKDLRHALGQEEEAA